MADDIDEASDELPPEQPPKPGWIARFISSTWTKLAIVLVTLVGVPLAGFQVYMEWHYHDFKNLSVYQTEKRPLVTRSTDAPASAASKLQIMFDGKVVQTPWACTIEIEDSGNVAIVKDDVEVPLTLTFSDAKVLIAEPLRTQPRGIRHTVESDNHTVTIKHGLLNPGDRIAVNCILDGEPSLPDIDCRITGVKEVTIKDLSTDFAVVNEPYFDTPRIISIIVASLLSVVGLLIGIVAALFFLIATANVLRTRRPTTTSVYEKVSSAIEERITKTTRATRLFGTEKRDLFVELFSDAPHNRFIPNKWLDQPNLMDEFLIEPKSLELLNKYGETPESAKELILEILTQRLCQGAASEAYTNELPDWSQEVFGRISKLKFTSSEDLCNKVGRVLKKYPPERFSILPHVYQVISIWLLATVLFVVVGGLDYLALKALWNAIL